jgi:hypothetical protein
LTLRRRLKATATGTFDTAALFKRTETKIDHAA